MFTSFGNIFGPVGVLGNCVISPSFQIVPITVDLCVPNIIDGGIPNFLVSVSVPHIVSSS